LRRSETSFRKEQHHEQLDLVAQLPLESIVKSASNLFKPFLMEERNRSRYVSLRSVWDVESAPSPTTFHKNAHSSQNMLRRIVSNGRNNDWSRHAIKYDR